MALSKNDIESELSYAYLHAVTSKLGGACSAASRHEDNAGVDASVTIFGPFSGSYIQEVDIKVQLKATIQDPILKDGHYSYSLKGINRYNELRAETHSTPRILVVLFLPTDEDQWLVFSESELTLKRCSYWVSLRGAPSSTNSTSQTIYIPQPQTFDPANLKSIATRVAERNWPKYELPDD